MFGILLAILSALFFACGDVGKKSLSLRIHPYVVNWIPVSFGVILGAIFFATVPPPLVATNDLFWLALGGGIFFFFVELTFLWSIRDGEISLVMPLTAFVPIVSGVIAWFISGEAPSEAAFVGIGIIVLASWLMFAESGDLRQALRPVQRMLSSRAARAMLLFSVLNGIFVNLMNYGGDRSSGVYFLWLVLIIDWIVLTGVMVLRRINPWPPIRANRRTALLTGLFWALGMGFFFESLSHTMVAYAMAAKCTHTIFIVVLGCLIFNEHDFRKRLSASALLVLGLCVLLLGN